MESSHAVARRRGESERILVLVNLRRSLTKCAPADSPSSSQNPQSSASPRLRVSPDQSRDLSPILGKVVRGEPRPAPPKRSTKRHAEDTLTDETNNPFHAVSLPPLPPLLCVLCALCGDTASPHHRGHREHREQSAYPRLACSGSGFFDYDYEHTASLSTSTSTSTIHDGGRRLENLLRVFPYRCLECIHLSQILLAAASGSGRCGAASLP